MNGIWVLFALFAQSLCIPGGWETGDVNDPILRSLLEQKYFPGSGLNAEDMELIAVETQVVAGTNYRATFQVGGQTCQVVIFYQPWTETTEILSDTCQKPSPMAGGWSPADINQQSIARDLLNEVYFPSSGLSARDLQLKSLETQVVAGVNYKYTFQVIGTDSICQVVIFHQVWTSTKAVTQDTCFKALVIATNPPLIGGWSQGDLSDPMVQTLLDDVYYPNSQVSAENLELVRVETQVVAGFNYRMTFNVVGTGKMCTAVIFVQPWKNTQELTSDTCLDVISGRDRLRTGPSQWHEVSTDDDIILSLLEELYFPSNTLTAEDIELIKAERRWVAGMNYRLTFNILEFSMECEVLLYTLDWTDTKMILEDGCTKKIASHRAKLGSAAN